MGKTYKDQRSKEDRIKQKGFGSPKIPAEDKKEWQARGGRERAKRGSGHSWTRFEARAHGLRAYLHQIMEGRPFGKEGVRVVPQAETPEPAQDIPSWEGVEDDEDLA